MSNPRHVVCPHCLAVNRIPSSRLGEAPKCGQCHRALFDGKPHEVSGSAFQKHVSRNDIPVVVDFWAEWCGPCRMMAPEFERAAASLGRDFRLLKLNTEAEQEIAARLGIRSIPTMVMFAGGREIARQSGAMRAGDIERWVRGHAPAE
ncbi:MAG TPA: thioredoxin TrxC [Gammaproteobacteria bacterium]